MATNSIRPTSGTSTKPLRHHRRGHADQHQRGAVVEQALALHDCGQPVRHADAAEGEQHADGVGDGEHGAEQQRDREREADLPGRDGRGGEERHGHARHGQGQDRPGGLAQAGGIGRQRPLEDQDRQEHHQHDARIHGCLGQHLEQHEHQADDDQRNVIGHADPPRHDRHAGADREHGQQLFEVLTHGRAAAGDNASTPTLYVMADLGPMDFAPQSVHGRGVQRHRAAPPGRRR